MIVPPCATIKAARGFKPHKWEMFKDTLLYKCSHCGMIVQAESSTGNPGEIIKGKDVN